jgi:hypothetical protein
MFISYESTPPPDTLARVTSWQMTVRVDSDKKASVVAAKQLWSVDAANP